MKTERQKFIDKIKEDMLVDFLKDLNRLAFIKSTNSISGKVEHFPEAVEDMEAVIRINGEFDREDLKDFIYKFAPTE
jgi:hypothetical protein